MLLRQLLARLRKFLYESEITTAGVLFECFCISLLEVPLRLHEPLRLHVLELLSGEHRSLDDVLLKLGHHSVYFCAQRRLAADLFMLLSLVRYFESVVDRSLL